MTLKTADNNKLNELLETGFERSVIWNEYKSAIQTVTQAQNDNNFKRIMLDASYPGVNRPFVAIFNDIDGNFKVERNSHMKYFLPRTEIKDYNVLIDGRSHYDQNINIEF